MNHQWIIHESSLNINLATLPVTITNQSTLTFTNHSLINTNQPLINQHEPTINQQFLVIGHPTIPLPATPHVPTSPGGAAPAVAAVRYKSLWPRCP